MKKHLFLIFLLTCLGGIYLSAQNDTVRHVIFTEWRGDDLPQSYCEVTNMGDSAVDLGRFTLQSVNPWMNTYGAEWAWFRSTRLWGTIQPGESKVIMNFTEVLTDFGEWNERPTHKPGLAEKSDIKIYVQENVPLEQREAGVVDSIYPSDGYEAHAHWWGGYASVLFYNFDDGVRDSVIVDVVNLFMENPVEYPNVDLYPESAEVHHIAGVFEAPDDHILVRKFIYKEGTPWDEWTKAAGVSLEDSEWMPIKENEGNNPGGAIFTTVGNHGDFQLDYSSTVYDIDEANQVINVPWGTQRGDSTVLDDNNINLGPGMAWEYVLNGVHEDSALTICATGDILILLATGNELQSREFRIEVDEPTNTIAEVFRRRHTNDDEEDEYFGSYSNNDGDGIVAYIPYYVTEDDPVIDTIGDVPFATRVDTLLTYLTVPSNANISFDWVDDVERADLKLGDELVVTAGNGTTSKRYYIKVDEYEESIEAKLAAITWPDKPAFVEGWFWGDTIPGFSSLQVTYKLTLPMGTENVPALVATPLDLNATIEVQRAQTLKGSVVDRTSLITVTAEDDTSFMTYEVIFDVEVDPADFQVLDVDPVISEAMYMTFWNNSAVELANPSNVEKDFSNYMIIRAGGESNPADAVTLVGALPDTANFNERYCKYVPGFKFTDNVTEWIAEPGILIPDPTVEPIVAPQDVFVALRMWNTGSEWRYDEDLWGRADIGWSHYFENGWGMFSPDLNTDGSQVLETVGSWTPWHNLYVYEILNDSVLDGTKPATDPLDFKLVDAIGAGTGDPVNIGGTEVTGWYWTIKRKPDVYIGAKTTADMVAALGATPEESQWVPIYQSDPIVPTDYLEKGYWMGSNIGVHGFDLITGHISKISSKNYNVSPGYVGDQTITGTISGTLDQLLEVMLRADDGQALSLHSNVDGSVKAGADAIAENDTLVVFSADSMNVTRYVLVNQPLSDNALLTSEVYTIEVAGEAGTINGLDFGVTLSSVLDNVNIPDKATLNVIDGVGELIPLQVVNNFDSVYAETMVGDDVYFEVVAEDLENIVTYHLMPNVMASDAFVVSSLYKVEEEFHKIFGIPLGTAVPTFLDNIIPASGATVTVMDKFGQPRTEGVIAYDDILEVVSQDETVTVTYHIEFLDETTTLANAAPNLLVETNSFEVAVDQTFSVSVTATDDGPAETLTYMWSVSAGEAGNVTFSGADLAATDVTVSAEGSYTLQIDVNDGALTSSESVAVTVTPTDIGEFAAGSVKLYPNPVSGTLNVELSSMNNSGAILKVYSITGVAVLNAELHQLSSKIDLGMLEQGIYLVSIKTDDQLFLHRIQLLKE